MTDLVGTCPKGFWHQWIAEGDCAGDPTTGTEWGWYVDRRPNIQPGDRLYIVAHGKLRGWAPVTAVRGLSFDPAHGADGAMGVFVAASESPKVWRGGKLVPGADMWCICREGGAVACTVPGLVTGFRGLRTRWWDRAVEVPFPGWRTP